ncbi:DUF6069 family protein [Streptomyces reniochalinae]|uniref:Uncharacterized protein n=1 Tax=Streptomyces reniochalinae TaxID=2250578 RepID=A0A367F5M3_9ACTN|nr:DUF6069 family protein [Streptomyces reniochalinae]RCG25249.1 hypothetical protein DQ392_01740 [Streptomyces reniochalinae]
MSASHSATRTVSPVRTRALAVVGAVVLAALIWVLADPVLGVDLRTPDGPGSTTTSELALPVVIVSVAVLSLVGWGLLALLERLTGRARTVWSAIACAVVVLSLFAPLFSAGLSGGNRVALVCLHLAVGAVLIPAYRKDARQG